MMMNIRAIKLKPIPDLDDYQMMMPQGKAAPRPISPLGSVRNPTDWPAQGSLHGKAPTRTSTSVARCRATNVEVLHQGLCDCVRPEGPCWTSTEFGPGTAPPAPLLCALLVLKPTKQRNFSAAMCLQASA